MHCGGLIKSVSAACNAFCISLFDRYSTGDLPCTLASINAGSSSEVLRSKSRLSSQSMKPRYARQTIADDSMSSDFSCGRWIAFSVR